MGRLRVDGFRGSAALAIATSALTVAGWLVWPTAALAAGATYYASPSGAGSCSSAADACDLATAIGKTADGDTVVLEGGTYASTHVTVGDSITLVAATGATPVLDGNGVGGGFVIDVTGSASATVDGLTFQDSGQEIVAESTALTVKNSTFTVDADGATNTFGVNVFGSTDVTVSHSTFTVTSDSSTADVWGSGVANQGTGTLTVDSSKFTVASEGLSVNAVSSGVLGFSDDGSVVVENSHFTSSASGAAVGSTAAGVDNAFSGHLTVTGSTFHETSTSVSAPNYAAGIVSCFDACKPSAPPVLQVDSSDFTSDTEVAQAGVGDQYGTADGIDTYDDSAQVTNSTFTGSASAPQSGSYGVYAHNASGTLLIGDTANLTTAAEGASVVGFYGDSGGPVGLFDSKLTATVTGGADENAAGMYSDAPVALVQHSTLSVKVAPGLNVNAAAIIDEGSAGSVTDSTLLATGPAYGLVADTKATPSVVNSTIVGSGAGSFGVGAYDGSTATVEQSTITQAGTGVLADGSQAILGADIVAGNGTDCATADRGSVSDEGANIDSDGSCGFSAANGSVSHSATIAGSLGPLADNGGPTKTVGLEPGSPAIGLVDGAFTLSDGTTACANDDQRGVARPGAGQACDAGAFEGTLTAPPSSPPPAGPPAPTLSLTSNVASPVFGQPVTVTAALSPLPSCGTLQWVVDGVAQGTPVTLTGASNPSLTLGPLSNLEVGSHTITLDFSGCASAGAVSKGLVVVVGKGSTTTTLTVDSSTYTAKVQAVPPAVGTPTGTVTFYSGGSPVATVPLGPDGTATYTATAGSPATAGAAVPNEAAAISATYSGDSHFAGSTASAAASGTPPTISARVSSAHPKTKAGWYRGPVTITFTCQAGSATLAAPGCPAPVTLRRSGAAQSVTRTVQALDGQAASVTVSPINIDRTPPTKLQLHGATPGHLYAFAQRNRKLTCSATDPLSGVRACRVSRTHVVRQHVVVVHYTMTATNHAGGVTTRRGWYSFRRAG